MEQSYKEKYEQALAKAKEQYNYPCMRSCMGILEEIFPELAESGDEKVRKALIDFFGKGAKYGSQTNGVYDKDILAWLERQGEQKTITFNNAHIIDPALNDYCCKQYDALHKENGGVLSFARLQHLAMDIYGWCKEYLQGEQKPNPCDGCVNRKGCVNCENGELREIKQKPADKVEPKFKVGDKIRRKTPSSFDKDMQVARIEKDYYVCNHIGKFSSEVVPFSKQSSYELIEQKPAWSEEDECYMSECIGAIATKDGWSFDEKRKTKHWLKSLKERKGGKI